MDKLNRDVGRHEWQSLIVIGAMLIIGAVLYLIDPKQRLEAWLQKSPAKTEARSTDRYDVVLPGWAIGIVSLLSVIAFSIVAATFTTIIPPQPLRPSRSTKPVQSMLPCTIRKKFVNAIF